MTVIDSLGRISWKVAIPIIIFWVAGGIGIWFMPFNLVGSSYPFLDAVLNHPVMRMVVCVIASCAALFGVLGTLAWTIYGEKR